jgi:hypothetical protein
VLREEVKENYFKVVAEMVHFLVITEVAMIHDFMNPFLIGPVYIPVFSFHLSPLSFLQSIVNTIFEICLEF